MTLEFKEDAAPKQISFSNKIQMKRFLSVIYELYNESRRGTNEHVDLDKPLKVSLSYHIIIATRDTHT